MQKTTSLVDQFGNPLQTGAQLVVAVQDANGNIDQSSVQPLNGWNTGPRSGSLVARAHGYELLDILTNELGLVDIDDAGLLRFSVIMTLDPHVAAMRVLGRIAEAIIVRECNSDDFSNRRWGMIARKGNRPHRALDEFKAIGTGLGSTQRIYASKYNPTNPHRDVIWIHKDNAAHELLQIVHGSNAGVSAGLQVKVSHDGFKYLYRSDVATRRYEVPLVYFDLGNDFQKLANQIYAERLDVAIGTDFVRGHSISPECHDLLVSYYWLVLELVAGRMSLDHLVKDDLLFDAFKKDVQEQNLGKSIIVV